MSLFLLVLPLVAIGERVKAVVVLAFSVLFRYLKTACRQQEGAKPYFSVPADTVGQFTFRRDPTALSRGKKNRFLSLICPDIIHSVDGSI